MELTYQNLSQEIDEILKEKTPDAPDYEPVHWIGERMEDALINPGKGIIASEWNRFTEMTGGLRPREFTILCGATGSGKTTWLAGLSTQLILQNVPHYVASVETGNLDFGLRVLSVLDRKDHNDGRAHSKKEVDELMENYKWILGNRALHLAKYSTKISPKRILCDLLHANKVHGCKIAMIDNLNFLMPFVESRESLVTMDKVVHDFIIFCKNIDMHVIMVMHPRKTENGRVENENDVKGSSTAVQEAQNIFLFNRVRDEDEPNGYSKKIHRDLKIAKMRRRGQWVGARVMFEYSNAVYIEKEVRW